jgi:hypothetical protein
LARIPADHRRFLTALRVTSPAVTQNARVAAEGIAEAVLVTGVYGAGKSTVIADMGKVLSDHGQRYGLIDVDWVGWFDVGMDDDAWRRVVLSNVQHLVEVYVREGARCLALAWWVRSPAEVDQLQRAISLPLRVVQLRVSADLVRERLGAAPTEERQGDDLQTALQALADDATSVAGLVLPGDRPIRETSLEICEWLGWI